MRESPPAWQGKALRTGPGFVTPSWNHPLTALFGSGAALLGLCRHEVAVLRRVAHTPGPHRWRRWCYQAGIALLRPVTVWMKWELAGLPLAEVRLQDRTELLRLGVRVALDAERTHGDGLWLEFGVFEGSSIREIASSSHRPVVGFDSFEGLPRGWGFGHRPGKFSTRGRLPDVGPSVDLVPGWFEETLPPYLTRQPTRRVSFVHVDCDLYSSARTVLRALQSRCEEGTVVVFDEFAGLLPDDEARAFRELLHETGFTSDLLGISFEGSVAFLLRSPRAT